MSLPGEQLISRWRQESYDEQHQRDFLAVLLRHREELNACYRAYLNEKATAIQSVVDCGLNTTNAEELPARFMAKIPG